jgi:hypothetical protein
LPPTLHSEPFFSNPSKVLFSKSRLYGPTHWKTILHKVWSIEISSHLPQSPSGARLWLSFYSRALLTDLLEGKVRATRLVR